MGIAGHILGAKKLRRLASVSGLPLATAFIRGRYAEGVVHDNGSCTHYSIDPRTGEHEVIDDPCHWTSCPPPAGLGAVSGEDWLALPDCPHCAHGEVWDPTAKGNTRPCGRCGGSGKVQPTEGAQHG